jgi:Tol biopolymer transport system component/DNA-binding winged helix-turn-helix (wHTH) protein
MSGNVIRFGLFELNSGSRQLFKQGRRVRLQDQPFRVLELLLERPGELVTRQEFQQKLWPQDVHVDFDLGLNGAIKRLRVALGDSGENPRFIETVPKRGYRFLAPIQEVATDLPVAQADSPPATAPHSSMDQTSRHRPVRAWVAPALIPIAALVAFLLRPMAPSLRVTRVTQLSNSGHAWAQESLMSDGARLYFTEFGSNRDFRFRQILLNGNEEAPVTGLPADSLIRSLSPDHTTFLAISKADVAAGRESAMWMLPVVGGPARRVGNTTVDDVSWSPDGRALVLVRDSQLLVAEADGTRERVLATVAGTAFLPRWSPDGSRIRCTVLDSKGQLSIWEVDAQGHNPHALQFKWPGSPMEGFGEWSPDGRHYIFVSRRELTSNLWELDESQDVWHQHRPDPVQLTAGPISYSRPLPSPDGTRIFALGIQPAGELVRYDAATKGFLPFLGGQSVDHAAFTRDGHWVAYVAYPEGTLWRAKSDGSEPLQLTFPPIRVCVPRWSPDGKRLLFVVRRPGEFPKVATIAFDGGSPEFLVAESHAQTAADWSPDGTSVVYGRDPDGENQDLAIYQVDLHTRRAHQLPGTNGLYAPIWSPDGRQIVAQSVERLRALVLVDPVTGARRTLATGQTDYPIWSADSQFVYFNTISADPPALMRVRVQDGRPEGVADVPFLAVGVYGIWSGLAPDGAPLLLRGRGQTDVYALTVSGR